jgi:hypothetical protein
MGPLKDECNGGMSPTAEIIEKKTMPHDHYLSGLELQSLERHWVVLCVNILCCSWGICDLPLRGRFLKAHIFMKGSNSRWQNIV